MTDPRIRMLGATETADAVTAKVDEEAYRERISNYKLDGYVAATDGFTDVAVSIAWSAGAGPELVVGDVSLNQRDALELAAVIVAGMSGFSPDGWDGESAIDWTAVFRAKLATVTARAEQLRLSR